MIAFKIWGARAIGGEAKNGNRQEPHGHDRPEEPADIRRSPVLKQEEQEKNQAGNGQNEGGSRLGGHFQTLRPPKEPKWPG